MKIGKIRRPFISLPVFLGVLLVISILAFATLEVSEGHDLFSIYQASYVTSSALSLVALVSIVAIPWRLLERWLNAYSNGPIIVPTLIFIVVLALNIAGRSYEYEHRSDTKPVNSTKLDTCELLIDFPSPPILKRLKAQLGGNLVDYSQASLATNQEYLRAECIPIAISQTDSGQTLMNQANVEGLQNITIEELSQSVYSLRGHKKVGGREATYVIQIHRSKSSALVVVAAAASSDYPTSTISEFLSHVH